MGKVSRKKRFKHRKRHRSPAEDGARSKKGSSKSNRNLAEVEDPDPTLVPVESNQCSGAAENFLVDNAIVHSDEPDVVTCDISTIAKDCSDIVLMDDSIAYDVEVVECPVEPESLIQPSCQTSVSNFDVHFHDYTIKSHVNSEAVRRTDEPDALRIMDPGELLLNVKKNLDPFLFKDWISQVGNGGIHVLLLSRCEEKSIQRRVFVGCDGQVTLSVHCRKLSIEPFLKNVSSHVPLHCNTVPHFLDRVVEIINNTRLMEICSGVDSDKYLTVWSTCYLGETDKNPYNECRYVETYRSFHCERLVHSRKWRCGKCSNLLVPFKRRLGSANKQPNFHTPNKFHTEEQKLCKLQYQRTELDSAKKKIQRLQDRMQQLLKKDGCDIDCGLSNDLMDVLRDTDLSPAQRIFLQQQVKASQQKNMKGMRWLPTLLRLVLSIHITSPAAYELLRDTGLVKLPSSRTLFDYSHARPVTDGIDKVVLENVANRVGKSVHSYQEHHVLLVDEMYISKNLVFQKSAGRLVGYTQLDELDKEVEKLNTYLDGSEVEPADQVSSRILTYMIKGVSNNVKEVVATYLVSNVSPQQMYVNGAHSSHGKKMNNYRLNPYTSVDERFVELKKFLDYLGDWRDEAVCNSTSFQDSTQSQGLGHLSESTEQDEINLPEEEETENAPASSCLLSHQTLLGIEMSTNAFIEVTKFLLKLGTKFVNARVLTQDPLEHHFSKLRSAGWRQQQF